MAEKLTGWSVPKVTSEVRNDLTDFEKMVAAEYNELHTKYNALVDEVSPETISTLTNPLVFTVNEDIEIDQTGDISLSIAGSGHASGRFWKMISINGNSTNTLEWVDDVPLDGDVLDNTKRNNIGILYRNGVFLASNKAIPLPDIVNPSISSESLASDNSYTTITLSEPSRDSGGSELTLSNVNITFTQNGDDTTTVTKSSITDGNGDAISVLTDTIRVYHTLDNPSTGLGSIVIELLDFEDAQGNETATDTTGSITLNDEANLTAYDFFADEEVYSDASGTVLATNSQQVEIWGESNGLDFDKTTNGMTYIAATDTIDNNGSGGMVLSDALDGIIGGSKPFTIMWCGRVTDFTSGRTILSDWDSTSGSEQMKFSLLFNASGNLVLTTSSNGSTQDYVITTDNSFPASTRLFVSLSVDPSQTIDSDMYKIRVNKVDQAHTATITTDKAIVETSGGSLRLNHRVDTSSTLVFQGKNAYLGVKSAVLSTTEIDAQDDVISSRFSSL